MMRSKLLMSLALGTAVALSAGGMPPALPTMHKAATTSHRRRKNALFGLSLPAPLVGTRYSRRTVAMDKRAAAKKRNQQRNKGR